MRVPGRRQEGKYLQDALLATLLKDQGLKKAAAAVRDADGGAHALGSELFDILGKEQPILLIRAIILSGLPTAARACLRHFDARMIESEIVALQKIVEGAEDKKEDD